jgi:hypothetical protein
VNGFTVTFTNSSLTNLKGICAQSLCGQISIVFKTARDAGEPVTQETLDNELLFTMNYYECHLQVSTYQGSFLFYNFLCPFAAVPQLYFGCRIQNILTSFYHVNIQHDFEKAKAIIHRKKITSRNVSPRICVNGGETVLH